MIFNVEVVDWVDSQGRGSWHSLKEAQDEVVCRIVTIGYVVGETDEAVTLVQSIDGPGGDIDKRTTVDNAITIPKVAITGRSVVEGVTYAAD